MARIVEYAEEKGVITFTVKGFAPITVDTNKLSPEIKAQSLIHGIRQKVADGGAVEKGAPVKDKYEGMLEVAKKLLAGKWTERKRGEPRTALIAEALARYLSTDRKGPGGKSIKGIPTTPEQAKAKYDGLPEEKQKALRSSAAIQTIIAQIKAERATPTDIDALL